MSFCIASQNTVCPSVQPVSCLCNGGASESSDGYQMNFRLAWSFNPIPTGTGWNQPSHCISCHNTR